MSFRLLLACFISLTFADVFLTSVRGSFSVPRSGMLAVFLTLGAHELIVVLEAVCLAGFVLRTYWISAAMLLEIVDAVKLVLPLWVIRIFLVAFPAIYRYRYVPMHGYKRAWQDAGYVTLVVLDIVFLLLHTLSALYVVCYVAEKSLYAPYHQRVRGSGTNKAGTVGATDPSGGGGSLHGTTRATITAQSSGASRRSQQLLGQSSRLSFSLAHPHHSTFTNLVDFGSPAAPLRQQEKLAPLKLKHNFVPEAMADPTLGLFATAVARVQQSEAAAAVPSSQIPHRVHAESPLLKGPTQSPVTDPSAALHQPAPRHPRSLPDSLQHALSDDENPEPAVALVPPPHPAMSGFEVDNQTGPVEPADLLPMSPQSTRRSGHFPGGRRPPTSAHFGGRVNKASAVRKGSRAVEEEGFQRTGLRVCFAEDDPENREYVNPLTM